MINFDLDKKSPVPFYRQIIDIVLSGMSGGQIMPGERLPTIRDLAVKLGVNPNTVAKAYSHLQLMGILDTQQGSGVYATMRESPTITQEEKQRLLQVLCRDFIGRAQLQNISIDDLIACLNRIKEELPK